jgi:hypothetical protein
VGNFELSVRMCGGSDLQIRDRDENDLLANLNPIWAAPEVLNGAPYSTPADVYAMGLMLWEFLFRFPPFHDVCLEVLKDQIIAGRRLDIRWRKCWNPTAFH